MTYMELYYEKHGRCVDMTKNKKIEVRIDDMKKELFREVCESKNKSFSEVIEEFINKEILDYVSKKG